MASKTLQPPIASISGNPTLIPNPKHPFSRPMLLSSPNHTSQELMHLKHTIKTRKRRTTLVHCCSGPEEESDDGGCVNRTDQCNADEQRDQFDSRSRRDRIHAKSDRDARLQSKFCRREEERYTYLMFALMSSLGIASMAIFAVYCRFLCRFTEGELPYLEMLATFALTVGACVGMEYWARWAHRVLWHGFMWTMHQSHHRPREGMLEVNDVFAISNALPAISLLSYGVCNDGLLPSLCFGAGLGITVFGIAYMFVHDGLVHRRFPVGPVVDCPYFQKIAAAHQLHHSERLKGVPYGLFLAPQEIEEVGGESELEREINRRYRNRP